jgi:hypothetical protein
MTGEGFRWAGAACEGNAGQVASACVTTIGTGGDALYVHYGTAGTCSCNREHAGMLRLDLHSRKTTGTRKPAACATGFLY